MELTQAEKLLADTNVKGGDNVENTGANVVADKTPSFTLEVPGQRVPDATWYMKQTEELAGVTAEASNPALGINGIVVVPATSAKQLANGIVAKVNLDTTIGRFFGITVVASTFDKTALRLQFPGRSVDGPNGKRWFNDYALANTVKAQILRHIQQFVKPAGA